MVSWKEKATSSDKKVASWRKDKVLGRKSEILREKCDILRRKSGILRRKYGILKGVKSWRVREYGIVKKQEEACFIFLEEMYVLFLIFLHILLMIISLSFFAPSILLEYRNYLWLVWMNRWLESKYVLQ